LLRDEPDRADDILRAAVARDVHLLAQSEACHLRLRHEEARKDIRRRQQRNHRRSRIGIFALAEIDILHLACNKGTHGALG